MKGLRCLSCSALLFARDRDEHGCGGEFADVNLADDGDSWEDERDALRLRQPRRCTTCRQTLDASRFSLHTVKGRLYRHSTCNPCKVAIRRERRPGSQNAARARRRAAAANAVSP